MKLLYNPASPFVRKVMIVAAETGLADRIELEAVALTPVNPNSSVVMQNPLGKIPALVLDDGSTLYDSRVICAYLNSLGAGDLYGTGDDQWQVLKLEAAADGISDAAVAVRYETFVRPESLRWDQWIEGQKNKVRRAIDSIESDVDCFGDQLDIGQIALAVALDYVDFRYPEEAWRDQHPQLVEWHSQLTQRPAFKNTLPQDLKT